MKNQIIFILVMALGSCKTSVVPVSKRKPLLNKEGTKDGVFRDISAELDKKYIDRKNKKIIIKKNTTKKETGSLMDLVSDHNDYFPKDRALQVGDYIKVKIESPRKKGKGSTKNQDEENPTDNQEGSKDELIRALPELGSPDKKPSIIKYVTMKVWQKKPNGDYTLLYRTESHTPEKEKYTFFTANLKKEKRFEANSISTEDLSEINFRQNDQNSEDFEVQSTAWLDEYSLRLSGFNEAQSKFALDLEKKKEKLNRIKNDLRNKIVSFSKERQKVVKSRDKYRTLLEKQEEIQKNHQDSLKNKENEIESLKGEIATLKQQVEELNAEKNQPAEEAKE